MTGKLSLDNVEKQAQAELDRNPSNEKFRIKLKDLLHYTKKAQRLIKVNEEHESKNKDLAKQYGEALDRLEGQKKEATERQKNLTDYESRLLLNTDRIALESASNIVPKTDRKGRPRPIQDIMTDIKAIMPDILNIITPEEKE